MAFINQKEIDDHILQLQKFYNDFDFKGINLDKDLVIKNTANLIYRFKDINFETTKHLLNNTNGIKDKFINEPHNQVFLASIDYKKILDPFLKNLLIYKYALINDDFLNIIAFYYELIKDKIDRDKTKEPLRLNHFSTIYTKAQIKLTEYRSNLLLLFDDNYLNTYINLLYDIKHYRLTNEDKPNIANKHYELRTRNDLKKYIDDFKSIITFFIDLENLAPTPICFNDNDEIKKYIDTELKEIETLLNNKIDELEKEKQKGENLQKALKDFAIKEFKINLDLLNKEELQTLINGTQQQKDNILKYLISITKQQQATTEIIIKAPQITKALDFYGTINKKIRIEDNTKQNEEKSERRLYKFANTDTDINKDYEAIERVKKHKKEIAKFRKENPDFIGTDEEILKLTKQYTQLQIYDFLDDEAKQKFYNDNGIELKRIKDKKNNDLFIIAKEKSINNIMNIADKDLYKVFGLDTIKTLRFCEALVFNFMLEKGIENLTAETTFLIDPTEYNNFFNLKNDLNYTREKIYNSLFLLKAKQLEYTNTDSESILNTKEKTIDYRLKKDTEKTKNDIKNIIQVGKLTTDIISNFAETIKDNKKCYLITFNISRIYYYKLIYANTRFITDNTQTITAIKGNTLKRELTDFLKSLLLYYTKTNRENRKNKDFTKLEWNTTIKFIKDKFIENELIKENRKKYKQSIYNPIFNTLEKMKNDGIIDYYTQAFNFYNKQVADKKRNYFNNFEAQEITITLLNDYEY